MKMSETQRKLREWFRRHRWHTVQTVSGHGFCLESPVHHQSGALRVAVNPKTGKKQYYEYDVEVGLHAYLALVLSKEEDIVFESHKGNGGIYVYIPAEMPWEYVGKVKSVSEDEADELFRKYADQRNGICP